MYSFCLKPFICRARKHVRLFGKERTFALLCIPWPSLDRPSLAETFAEKIWNSNIPGTHYHHLQVNHLVPIFLQPCRLLLFWPKATTARSRSSILQQFMMFQLQNGIEEIWFSWVALGSNHKAFGPSFSEPFLRSPCSLCGGTRNPLEEGAWTLAKRTTKEVWQGSNGLAENLKLVMGSKHNYWVGGGASVGGRSALSFSYTRLQCSSSWRWDWMKSAETSLQCKVCWIFPIRYLKCVWFDLTLKALFKFLMASWSRWNTLCDA